MWNWTENQIELYLIRHGMTLGNVEHRYIGRQTDEPLSEDGRQQLEKRKDQWAQVCRTGDMPYVFVSPMLRCRQTAEILFMVIFFQFSEKPILFNNSVSLICSTSLFTRSISFISFLLNSRKSFPGNRYLKAITTANKSCFPFSY